MAVIKKDKIITNKKDKVATNKKIKDFIECQTNTFSISCEDDDEIWELSNSSIVASFSSEINENANTSKKKLKLEYPVMEIKDNNKYSNLSNPTVVKIDKYDKILSNISVADTQSSLIHSAVNNFQSKCINDNMHKFNNRSTIKNEFPVQILFKVNEYEKMFYCDFKDSTDELYTFIGKELSSNLILIYEDMKLPKGLTLEEAGFFEGMNYLTVDDDSIKLFKVEDFQIRVNYIDRPNSEILKIKNLSKLNEEDVTVEILLKNKKDFIVVKNGSIINNQLKIKDVFSNNDACDIISKSSVIN